MNSKIIEAILAFRRRYGNLPHLIIINPFDFHRLSESISHWPTKPGESNTINGIPYKMDIVQRQGTIRLQASETFNISPVIGFKEGPHD